MNTNESRTNRPAAIADDVFVSSLIPARHWIASIAALAMTTLILAVVSLPVATHTPAMAWVDGIHVTNLAPVVVEPTKAELRAAALLEHAVIGTAALPVDGSAARLGAQLAMPYYSFGAATASSKE